jgi:hypothetical protein
MSIWDDPETKAEAQPNSRFLKQALQNGDSITLQFVGMTHPYQKENAKFPTADGREFIFEFKDNKNRIREINQNTNKGKFFLAMRDAGIEPDNFIKVTRRDEEGEFTKTDPATGEKTVELKMIANWEIEKIDALDAVGSLMEETKELRPPKEEVDVKDIPF